MKLLFSFIITGFLLLTNFNSIAAWNEPCTSNNGVYVVPHSAAGYTDNNCQIEPDLYAVTIYELGLCTAYPSPPTSTSAFDSSSVCTPVFTNSTGAFTVIVKNISTVLAGTIVRPPNGNYPYAYARIGTDFVLRSNFELSSPSNAYDIDTQSGEDNTAGAVGKYCATKTATVPNEGHSHLDGIDSTICGSTPPTAGLLTQVLRDFNGATNGLATAWPTSGTSISGTDDYWISDAAGYSQAYLEKENGLLPTAHAQVQYIVSTQKFKTPVVITENSSSIDMKFNVSEGMDIDLDDTRDNDLNARLGPFSILMTVQ